MKGKKILACALSVCAFSCAWAGSALYNKGARAAATQKSVEEFMTVSSGLNVEYNVSGVEKNSSLTKDTRKGIHFSSKEVGNDAEGESVAFNNVLSGLFETDFRIYTENKNTATDWWDGGAWYTRNNAEEVREFAITLTDKDKNESFTLYIKGGTSYNSRAANARVAYGDVGENYGAGQWYLAGDGQDYDNTQAVKENGLSSAEYNTTLRGTGFTNNFLHSTVVGFDPLTKEVYGYTFKTSGNESDYASALYKRVILDLDNPEHLAFAGDKAGVLLQCDFDNYTVKYTLTDVTGADEDGSQEKDEQAKFILYSINGQSLAGENGTLTENVAPGLKVEMPKTVVVGGEGFELPTPTLKSFFGESPTFTGKVKVLSPSGKTVLSERTFYEGYSITPTEEGTYKVVYSGVKDGVGNVRKAFAKDGTYSGSEVVYSVPVVAVKATEITGDARKMLTTSGLNVEYDVAGVEKNADLTRDTQKGIYFSSVAKGEEAEGSYVAFKNQLIGNMELNFRVFTDKKNESASIFQGGDWWNNNDAEEIKELAITVTDSLTGEMFTVYLKGGTSWSANTPEARVAYGDVGEYYGSGYHYAAGVTNNAFHNGENKKGLSSGEYNTSLRGTTFTNASRTSDSDFKSGYTTNIGFDPQTKEVYGYIYGSGAYACYKRVILDLDDAEDLVYAMKPSKNGAPVDVAPSAFKNSTFEKYTVKITVTDVADVEKTLDKNGNTVETGEAKQAKFIVYNLNGQSLAGEKGKLTSNSGYGAYVAETPVAFVNLGTKFPAPSVNGSVVGGEKAFTGTIKVVDEKGVVVMAEQPYSKDVVFTPTKTGKYYALYGGMADENGYVRGTFTRDGYSTTESYTRVPFEAIVPIELPETTSAMKNVPAWIGAEKAVDELTVLLTIKKDGVVYKDMDGVEIDEHFSYAFADNGEYELIYVVKAPTGTETQVESSIEVFGMHGAIVRPDTLATYGQDFIFTNDDFKLYYGSDGIITDFELYAEVYDGEEWLQLSAVNGQINFKETFMTLGEGAWAVRFTLTKGEDKCILDRTYTVVDKIAPILQAGTLTGEIIQVDSENGVVYYVVKQGVSVVVPACVATDDKDGELAVEILVKTPNNTQGVATAVGQSVVFDANGRYVIVYVATDNAGNYSTFAYVIDVKQAWFTVSAQDQQIELGSSFTPSAPTVYDEFTSTVAQGYQTSVSVAFGSDVLAGVNGVFYPSMAGVYTVTYTVEKDGAIYSCTVNLTVVDTQKPVIFVEGEYQKKAKIGDEIEILYAYVEDYSACDLEISITRDGTNRITAEYTFTIEEGGRYVIKYTATDMSGNTTSVEFVINVPKAKTSSSGGGSCSGNAGLGSNLTVVVALVGIAVLHGLKKKSNKKI